VLSFVTSQEMSVYINFDIAIVFLISVCVCISTRTGNRAHKLIIDYQLMNSQRIRIN